VRLIIAVLLWSVSVGALAQSVHLFKSVHADGTVSYSDTRPASASSVTEMSVPQTDAGIVNQGRQRQKEMEAIGNDLEKQRAQKAESRRKYENRLAQARREVGDAERNLATTRASKHNATEERIGLAEQRLALARQRLREVQNAGPQSALAEPN
jgi:peptidoglycan hydrolase CwlO-like protein